MAASLVQQSRPIHLTRNDLEALIQAIDRYHGFWRPEVSFGSSPIGRKSGTRWLCLWWAGPVRRAFIPPVSVVRDGPHYFIVVLDPFVMCTDDVFEEFPAEDLDSAISALQMVLDELWNIALQVGQSSGGLHGFSLQTELTAENNRSKRGLKMRGNRRKPFNLFTGDCRAAWHCAYLLKYMAKTLKIFKPLTCRGVIALLSALFLLSIVCASEVWGFSGEACGRLADDYDILRWCQVELELGGIDEVVTRSGKLRHGSGNWYLEDTDLEGESLWTDIRRLPEAEMSHLISQCGAVRCRVKLTGIARDRMIIANSIEVLKISE